MKMDTLKDILYVVFGGTAFFLSIYNFFNNKPKLKIENYLNDHMAFLVNENSILKSNNERIQDRRIAIIPITLINSSPHALTIHNISIDAINFEDYPYEMYHTNVKEIPIIEQKFENKRVFHILPNAISLPVRLSAFDSLDASIYIESARLMFFELPSMPKLQININSALGEHKLIIDHFTILDDDLEEELIEIDFSKLDLT